MTMAIENKIMSENTSMYWPDESDPLGQVHGRVKYLELTLQYWALQWYVLQQEGYQSEADLLDRSLGGSHGESWIAVKRNASEAIQILIRQARDKLATQDEH